ncbi:hypothetical protein MTR67_000478 [Solanum verrucosum]|uniref:Uncharacterized protein n=1 Tax=Solanum verrucosum TaxID=315347 RepID=A0AAF0PLG3_SOLVR|nr:hypothetical protein MTR67_000478 [Solanum verrucosum]
MMRHRYSGSSTEDSLIHPGVPVSYVSQDEGSLGDQQWSSSTGHVQGVGSGRDILGRAGRRDAPPLFPENSIFLPCFANSKPP